MVNSDNRHGDATNRKGIVQAEIIKGNIPGKRDVALFIRFNALASTITLIISISLIIVKNGVVHLINKPLVVIHLNVYQTLEVSL